RIALRGASDLGALAIDDLLAGGAWNEHVEAVEERVVPGQPEAPVAGRQGTIGEVEVDARRLDARDVLQEAGHLGELTAARASHQGARRRIVVDHALV